MPEERARRGCRRATSDWSRGRAPVDAVAGPADRYDWTSIRKVGADAARLSAPARGRAQAAARLIGPDLTFED